MKTNFHSQPRKFSPLPSIELSDMGSIYLEENEQITILAGGSKGNDITRKSWGYYLSNSLNSNLVEKGFRTGLVVSYASSPPRLYLNLVENDKINDYLAYLTEFNAKLVCWLDEWPLKQDSVTVNTCKVCGQFTP